MEKRSALLASLLFGLLVSGAYSRTFTFVNKCAYEVWAGTQASAGSPALTETGFQLDQGASVSLEAPSHWSGRFWGRTGCAADATGQFKCKTGDCGSNKVACNGAGAIPPATLIEFTLDGGGGQDFYDTSLVDGYNVPFSVNPQGGSGSCGVSACGANINAACPPELKVTDEGGAIIACKSACEAFNTDEYCCRGAFGGPDTCNPNKYSTVFKQACPTAYSYAYDDKTSTFTCKAPAYILTFCP
ncbi:thaumatin-like protein 1b [Aristolochia californica]|uniref:thaumatin-like protein 1b n=1 Tax=Aristolochia californica TaxID=171875 RepID=UPI0035D9456E